MSAHRHPAVVLFALALGLVVSAWGLIPLGASDLFWHLRTGALALDHGGVFPPVDVFSFLIAGTRWNNHEWLFDLLVASLHRATGGLGVFRLQALLVPGAAVLGLGRWVHRRAGPAAALAAATSAFLFASAKFTPSPQALSMLLFFTGWWAFCRPRVLQRAPWAVALVGFLVLWSNLTAEALTFLPFLFVAQTRGLVRTWPSASPGAKARAVGWLVAAGLAPLLTPPWSSTVDYLLHGTAANLQVNAEFSSLFAPAATVPPLVKVLAGLLALALAAHTGWRARARLRAASSNRARLLALLTPASTALAVLGAVRFERLLFWLALPVAAALVTTRWPRRHPRVVLGATAALLAAWAVAVHLPDATAWLRRPAPFTTHLDAAYLPVACAEPLAALPGPRRVFTTRLWASYVLYAAPQAQVFVDGRNREYPVEATQAALDIARGLPEALPVLEKTGADLVLLPPGWAQLPAVAARGWRTTFVGAGCALSLRDPPP